MNKNTVTGWWLYEGWKNRLIRRKTFYFASNGGRNKFAYQIRRKGIVPRPFKELRGDKNNG